MRGARRVASRASDLQRRSAPEISASDVQFFDERTFGRASVPGRPSGGWESGPWPGTSSVGLKSIGRDSDAIHCRLPAAGCRLSAVGCRPGGRRGSGRKTPGCQQAKHCAAAVTSPSTPPSTPPGSAACARGRRGGCRSLSCQRAAWLPAGPASGGLAPAGCVRQSALARQRQMQPALPQRVHHRLDACWCALLSTLWRDSFAAAQAKTIVPLPRAFL